MPIPLGRGFAGAEHGAGQVRLVKKLSV